MSIRITELDAITSLQSGDYIAVDNESTGTHKFDALNIGANIGQNIANTYSSSASYAIGQYCLYDNNLYKCITTISTPEAWNSSHWIQVTVGEGLYEKVDKISGKGLSTNDFTNAYKTKLDGIEDGAEVNVQANWTENDSSKDDYIKNKPENATTSISGFMSASDKQKLDGIEAGAEVNVQPNWAENDSSKDDYIKNKPTIDDALSTSSTNAVENSAIATAINNEATTRENADNALDGRIDTIEEILPNKANINGSYEEMTVGSAEQLISTESMEDSELYIFRKSGNGADIGDRETDMLVGGTIAWNQLAHDMSTWEGENNRTTVQFSNGVVSATLASGTQGVSAPAVREVANDRNVAVINHKYLLMFDCKSEKGASVYIRSNSIGNFSLPITSTWSNISVIKNASSASEVYFYIGLLSVDSSFDIGDGFSIKNFNLFDLTAMFGTEIADYIYSLEQAEAGKGVAWFRKYFPKPYYAYDAGSLQSVNVASHDMTGFNAWDEEWELGYYDLNGQKVSSSTVIRSKNKIKIMPNTNYYFRVVGNSSTALNRYVSYYDADENYLNLDIYDDNGRKKYTYDTEFTTPNNAYYMVFSLGSAYGTTYKGDICINISDVNRNGEYEEYVIHSYPYDESVQLRGIPQFVDGELKYDGDTYESSGKVTRKYGIVDLGTLDWLTDPNRVSVFRVTITGKRAGQSSADRKSENGVFCGKYVYINEAVNTSKDKYISDYPSYGAYQVFARDTAYTDATAFKTAMSGVYLIYQLATPTEEEAEGFTNPQIVDASGTEEYVDAGVKNDTRDVAIPVGHITQYVVNLRDKLQHLPFLAKEDGDYFVNQTGTQMSLKKVEGYYEDLVVGVADNLSTDIRTNDQTPYKFRTSGGSVDIGDRETDMIVGGTIAWNQLVNNFGDYGGKGTVVKSGTKYTYTFTELATNQYENSIRSVNSFSSISGHKYLEIFDVFCAKAFKVSIGTMTDGWVYKNVTANTKEQKSFIVSGNGTTPYLYIGAAMNNTNTFAVGDTFEISNIQVFDLTQMFGSTIADYIYSLEQANAGAGVSYFRKLFPKPYYEYNAGELLSVSGLQSHDMVGFNAWDGMYEANKWIGDYTTGEVVTQSGYNVTDYIPILPSTTYYKRDNGSSRVMFYDADKNVIPQTSWTQYITYSNGCTFTSPQNAHYMRFTITNACLSTFCINLSWDGSRDGEYEPYEKHSYALDDSLTLRGIPKLDVNNNLYYDGDTYESDGTVTRKWGNTVLNSSTSNMSGLTVRTNTTRVMILGSSIGMKPNATAFTNIVSDANTTAPDYVYTNDVEGVSENKNLTSSGIWVSVANSKLSATTYDGMRAYLQSHPITVVYPLATPTTESAEPYTNPQIVDDFGTEEYVIDSTIDVPIPVGHNTDYPINLKSKLEMAPDSPDGDGDYIVRQTNGTNEYVPLIIEDQLPAVPSTDGTYTLTVTIANGEATYSWT